MVKFKPNAGRVLVEKHLTPAESAGILLKQTTANTGTVVAVCDNCELAVGVTVILPVSDGEEINIDGKIYHVFYTKNILGYA